MAAEVHDLTKATRYVKDAQRIVWEQKGRIIRLRAAGVDASDAERTLRVLEGNLQTFREHQRAVELECQGPAFPRRLIAAE
jgi:hypothetical protein